MSNTRKKLSTAKTFSFDIKFLERLEKLSKETGLTQSKILQRGAIKLYPVLSPSKKIKEQRAKKKVKTNNLN